MIIDPKAYADWKAAYEANPAFRAAEKAISKHPIDEVVYDTNRAWDAQFLFNHEVKTMKVTNQKSSGRCWLFSSLNLFREIAAKKLNCEQFELSQNYIAYWDKLEKANYFLDSIMKTIELPKTDRLVDYIVSTAVGDGGQWDMVKNLVTKYGLVPKNVMPETFLSSNTRSLNKCINIKLRRTAALLRREYRSGADAQALEKIYEGALCDIRQILTAAYGCPPEKFDLEYRDKDNNFVRVCDLSPKKFFDEYIAFPFDEYVSLITSPTDDKPYNKAYTVRFLGNVVEGDPVCYLNTDIDTIKKAVMQMIDGGESVWFGSDVGWFMEKSCGALINDLTDYEDLFGGMGFKCSKEDKLDYRMSAMDHAMTITAYHEKDGKPVRWKIQNSWGEESGDKGYYVMDDEWFSNYVYQALVKKSLLSKDLLKALDEEKQVLDPWDPMGTLAE